MSCVFLRLLRILGVLAADAVVDSATARGLSVTAFSSSLPGGAGLGCSSAFRVASCAALSELSSLLRCNSDAADRLKRLSDGPVKDLHAHGGRRPAAQQLEVIDAWACATESMVHGMTSGLNNAASCHGGVVKVILEPQRCADVVQVSAPRHTAGHCMSAL